MPYCAVRWCGVNNMTDEFRKYDITFHRFPRIPRVKYEWVQAIRLRKDGWFPSYASVICSRHFKNECFVHIPHKNRRRLRDTAVPTELLTISMQDHAVDRLQDKEEREKREIRFKSRVIPITEKCEGEQIITNVYHYLDGQYITLRTYLPDTYELGSMSDILARTSDATGVQQETISDILKNEKLKKQREKLLMKQATMENFMKELQLDRNCQSEEKFQNSVIQLAESAPKTTQNNPQPEQSLLKTTDAKTPRAKPTTSKRTTAKAAKTNAQPTVAKPAAAKTIAAKTIAAKTIAAKTKPAKRPVGRPPKRVEYKETKIPPKAPAPATLFPNYSPISSDDEGVTRTVRDQAVFNKRCSSILNDTSSHTDLSLNKVDTKRIHLPLWMGGEQERREEHSGTVFGFNNDAEVENIIVEPDIRELCLQEEPNYGEVAEENITYTCDVQIQIQEVQTEPEYCQLYDYRIPIAVKSDATPSVEITRESTDNKIENNITASTYVQNFLKNIEATQPEVIKAEPENYSIEPNITTPNNQTVITHTSVISNTGMKTEPKNHEIEPYITITNNETVTGYNNTMPSIEIKIEPANYEIEPRIIISNIHSLATDASPITPKVETNTETERNQMQTVKLIINNMAGDPPDVSVFKYEPRSEFSDYYRNFV